MPPADHRAQQHEEHEDQHRVHLREVIPDRHEPGRRTDGAHRSDANADSDPAVP